MGITILAVSVLIGIYLIGSIYNSTEGDLPGSVTVAMGDTLSNATMGMTLMAVALIVIAAFAILSILGSRN